LGESRALFRDGGAHDAEVAGKPYVGAEKVALEEALLPAPEVDVLTIDEALQELEKLDPRQGQVVEMRFFRAFHSRDRRSVANFARHIEARLGNGETLASQENV
jgi:hypothetical protein